jgi:hypothetical protein
LMPCFRLGSAGILGPRPIIKFEALGS